MIALILFRGVPANLDETFTFDDLTRFMFQLDGIAGSFDRVSLGLYVYEWEPLSADQRWATLYFRICARFEKADELAAYYDQLRVSKLNMTIGMYRVLLTCMSPHHPRFDEFNRKVLGDMAVARIDIKEDTKLMKILLRNTSERVQKDLSMAMGYFKALQLRYLS
jgi:hypothetical protein